MKLNSYIAHSGYCSRRKAAELIKQGQVTINHFPVKDPSYEVLAKDTVRVGKIVIKPESHVYILFNKPTDCVTTTDDEMGRRMVLDYINIKQRVYPVGRLDYETTGLILLTNDGDLAEKLSHPRFGISKTYQAVLDKVLAPEDLAALKKGVKLSDGKVSVDSIGFVGGNKRGVRITLHSGKYRIIRRLFNKLGYEVDKLDRVAYAGISKRGLSVGAWRYLKDKEVAMLKELVAGKEESDS